MRTFHLVPITLISIIPICGCGAPGGLAPPGGPDADQDAAVRALEAKTGTTWTIRLHRDLRTPALLEGRTAPLIATHAAADTAAHAFLAENAAIFRLRAPREELVPQTPESDELGMAHVRLAQHHQGLPVWGHALRVHFDRDGALLRVDGRYAPLPALDRLAPVVRPPEAQARAIAQLGLPDADAETPQLVIDAIADAATGEAVPRLAWRVEVRAASDTGAARREVFVDAGTAEAYRAQDLLDDLRGTGAGVFGETRELEIAAKGARFALQDATAGSPPQRIYTAANGSRLPGTAITSGRPDRWDEVAVGAGAAVEAAANLAIVSDWYARVLGRRGALGKGAGMQATVHFGRDFANAFWDGKRLVFGDGIPGQLAPLSAGLDVVAHEFTHAVSEAAAGLGHGGEAGALNEAVSDVFAALIERDSKRASAAWTIGEDLFPGKRGALRDLANPHRTGAPAHLAEAVLTDDDRGGVHANATIPAHAAYLMTEGGANPVSGVAVDGVGATASARIWYRALTRYLGPSSEFRDAADATATAARDLFGPRSKEYASVIRAWQAVGVLAPR